MSVDQAPVATRAGAPMSVRFGATLVSNVARTAFAVLGGILVARALGAAGYGDLQFLLASFAAVRQLVDMGASSAFYTFIARRRRRAAFFAGYLAWLGLEFVATAAVIGLLLPRGVFDRVWQGHDAGTVLLAFVASFLMNEVWGMVSSLGEARRRTVLVQTALMAQSLVHLLLVGAAVRGGWLSVPVALTLILVEYAALVLALGPRLVRANVAGADDDTESLGTIVRGFVQYCRPLVLFSWVAFAYTFADRWLLHEFGRAAQQGHFAVSQQIAGVGFLIATSMGNVFWKEVAAAHEANDTERRARLYRTLTRSVYFMVATASGFVLAYGRELLLVTLGPAFEAAWLPLALLSVGTTQQAMAHMGATYLYAIGDTRSYTTVSLVIMAASIPVTYVMLAPAAGAPVPGLGLAASGLALKTLLVQGMGAIVLGWIVARAHGWRHELPAQIVVGGTIVGLAIASHALAGLVTRASGEGAMLSTLLLGATIYAVFVLALAAWRPGLAGLSRAELSTLVRAFPLWAARP